MRPFSNLLTKALPIGFACLFPVAVLVAEPSSNLTTNLAINPGMAPALGAASNFGQAWQPSMFQASQTLPVTDFRDAVYWKAIERSANLYRFDTDQTRYPDRLGPIGAGMSLTVNNGHPAYDGGHTPHSPESVAAFARFAAETVTRFPAIHSVEVGNEMNSDTFVSGPGWDGDLGARAVSYVALLKATAEQVKQANPSVRILGGAAHSIPLAWFQALFENGAAGYLDALVIHPYTVPAEQMQRQIAQLRQLPGAANIPIEVTEFGTKDAASAPSHLIKNYCQMALSGVTRVVWYPLNPRGDGLAPLLNKAGHPEPVGKAYQLISNEFTGRKVANAAPDPFTYACLFDDTRLVIWGEPRSLALAHPDLRVVDATGAPLGRDGLSLSRHAPLIVLSKDTPIELGSSVTLGPQQVIADSVDQFAYPGSPGDDPFERHVRQGGRDYAFQTRPGQEKGGVPWTPYLGSDRDGTVRAGADWLLPATWQSGPLEIAYRYRVAEAVRAIVRIDIAPSGKSVDGVVLTVFLNDAPVYEGPVTEAMNIALEPVDLTAGDVLEFVVGPGISARGDFTRFRVTILKDGA